jgi:hypothetical protein
MTSFVSWDRTADLLNQGLTSDLPRCPRGTEITAQQHAVTIDRAYQRIRRHARTSNASMPVVAEAIVAVGLLV